MNPSSAKRFQNLLLLIACLYVPLLHGQTPSSEKNSPVSELRKKALAGDAAAQLGLGFLYNRGDGVPRNLEQAVHWYHKAANQGNNIGQNQLGVMYAHGDGVPKDSAQAVKWYGKAANQGNPAAQTNLGLMYFKGEGVLKDLVIADMWFNLATAQDAVEDAKDFKDTAERMMTADQIAKAQKLSSEWKPKK